MKNNYYPPQYNHVAFNCPYCNVYAKQQWDERQTNTGNFFNSALQPIQNLKEGFHKISACQCAHCLKFSIWINHIMFVPNTTNIELPNEDMPDDVKILYNEAREVLNKSPKSAAALLRLALQKLMPLIGGKGKNINDDINQLVVNKCLDKRIQKVLDFLRVVGNNAVHPGVINLDDKPEFAHELFPLLNYIINELITKPKEIDVLFNKLPPDVIESINKRDNP